MKFHGGP